jgi:hypothetical protein
MGLNTHLCPVIRTESTRKRVLVPLPTNLVRCNNICLKFKIALIKTR